MRNFFLCLLAIAASATTTYATAVCRSKDEFSAYCTNSLGGVVNGGRCFFKMNVKASWADAFTQCKSQGGVGLAHIHTSSEMRAVTAYMQRALANNYVWVAHMRENYNTRCWITELTRSGWYGDASTLVPNLSSSNTWVRTRINDDCYARQGQCDHLWASFTLFGDYICTEKMFAVCMAVNPNQDYKLIPATCLTEVPIVSSPADTPIDCSNMCNDEGAWCRSFNYHTDSSTCELFSWSVADNPGKANMANCVHYTYLP